MLKKNLKNQEKFIEFIIDIDEPIYTTGVIQRLLDIPIWVIKQLDNEGIVSPPRKLVGSSRLYSKRELKKLAHCWVYMNEKGVNSKGLKVILEIETRSD
ncbi:MAG: MerR family transcriptional regulator [Candidatus Omnitrophica bacterium]|nr:MerR family transcriptional regulator [Candidatus Omnitrophota bacterium]